MPLPGYAGPINAMPPHGATHQNYAFAHVAQPIFADAVSFHALPLRVQHGFSIAAHIFATATPRRAKPSLD